MASKAAATCSAWLPRRNPTSSQTVRLGIRSGSGPDTLGRRCYGLDEPRWSRVASVDCSRLAVPRMIRQAEVDLQALRNHLESGERTTRSRLEEHSTVAD